MQRTEIERLREFRECQRIMAQDQWWDRMLHERIVLEVAAHPEKPIRQILDELIPDDI